MLSGFGLETMPDLIGRVAVLSRRAHRGNDLGAKTVSRRLPAIVAADFEDCSQLKKRLARSDRSELAKRRTFETLADSMLIEFANSVQATRIAAS
jgi:hypothetical protein